ncbi:hypothetical protein BDZ45DRAFT_457442 [Acephala macrosclerotiorum]|nr:hypothetical protein BDZ45DRAFT_457442 [Acephala macrosclerotiorum]
MLILYGAYSYDVQSQISGITESLIGMVSSNRWDARWPVAGFIYNVQVRASAGDAIKGDWTSVLSATANPLTAPGPLNVVVTPTATGFDVSWDPPTGEYTDSIIEYNIIYWDKSGVCDYIGGAAFLESPVSINGFVVIDHYLVAPVTWNAAGGGFP